ncbi:hypothetical protein [Bdellovibrio reynosensis]|uniref:Lipoprotein n=1 Tax=Bdellovibrio reynosensis TaxID=2835041 RepID=A0ABY4C9S5_9BACT|nr:hypothetical protein [Bdellovibrio reynosensis]UOF01717.1 hypothetical protein MNR06_01955 [Bdellovibrio reynosensis]
MKTSSLLAALFLGSSLLTSACTPADKAVTEKDLRLKIQAQNDRKAKKKSKDGGRSNSSSGARIGFFSLSSLILDKEVESVELYRLAAEIDKGDKSNARIKDRQEKDGTVSLVISLDNAEVNYTTTQGSFKTSQKKTYNVLSTADELTVTAANIKQSFDKTNSEKGKTYANLGEENYKISAKEKSDSVLEITLTTKSKVQISKEGQKAFENFNLVVVTEVDKESLATENVKVLKSSGTLTRVKDDGSLVDVKVEGTNHLLKMVGLCNSLIGSSKIVTGKGRELKSTETTVEVLNSSFKTSLGECQKRPTVDLSKLLLF